MKIALAFAAFIGAGLTINPVAAQTADAGENVTKRKPPVGLHRQQTIRTPSHETTECRPNDRKCEVELKLMGQAGDPLKAGGPGF
jgi:hypothetical protein